MNLQSIIDKAPDFKGARKLQPSEPARIGDYFFFLEAFHFVGLSPEDFVLDDLAAVENGGCIRIGWSLEDSLAAWVANGGSAEDFDGIIYRPTTS